MKFLAATLALASTASASTVALLPAGVSAAACPDYPFCSVAAPVAAAVPILNTTPEQVNKQHVVSDAFLYTWFSDATTPTPSRLSLTNKPNWSPLPPTSPCPLSTASPSLPSSTPPPSRYTQTHMVYDALQTRGL